MVPMMGPVAKDAEAMFGKTDGKVVNRSVMAFKVKKTANQCWSRSGRPVTWTNSRAAVFGRARCHSRGSLRARRANRQTNLSSKDVIDSWNHDGDIALAGGRIYLSTYDARVFAFGLPPQ